MDERFRSLRTKTRWQWLIAVAICLLTFGATAWRLDRAPDVFTDEILYTRAGIRVAGEGALVWDRGDPIFVHPPLYFLVEGAYWWLAGDSLPPIYEAGDIFASVYHARYLNAFFAGLTAALLYLIGWRLHGSGLGLLLVALFVLDPFGLRINRRAMLETLAVLLALAGMAVLLTGMPRTSGRRWLPGAIVAGLLLGAALLTKELTFTATLAVLLFGLWQVWRYRRTGREENRRAWEQAKAALVAVATATLTYGLYPLWMMFSGNGSGFSEVKALSLERLLGLVQISGWNRPGVSLASFFGQRLADYGSSYLILALGGAATLWLFLRQRDDHISRLLVVWGLVLYPFYGFVALFGSGNDQFFYFLLVPAILLVGCTAAKVPGRITVSRLRRPRILIVALLLALILPYNAARWWSAYGVGLDNAYLRLAKHVEGRLPPGEPLNASGDAIKFQYFFPDRPIASAATAKEAQAVGVHYFALAPKDVQARYGRTTPELAAWLVEQGQPLYSVAGDSFGDLFLYRVDYVGGPPTTIPEALDARPRQRMFGPAQGGFVAPLLMALGLWLGLAGGLSMWLGRRPVASPGKQPLRRESGAAQSLEAEHEHA